MPKSSRIPVPGGRSTGKYAPFNRICMAVLTADPELKSTPSGKSVATFWLATNRVWTDPQGKKNEATEFHNIVLWGRSGEVVKQFCTKGSELMVEGRIATRTWEDKQGAKHYMTEIVGENIQLGGRPTGAAKAAEAVQAARSEDEEEMKSEDLPF